MFVYGDNGLHSALLNIGCQVDEVENLEEHSILRRLDESNDNGSFKILLTRDSNSMRGIDFRAT